MKHLQLSKYLVLSLFSTFIFISCSSDDSGDTNNDPQTVLEEKREETTQVLTNTSNKTWKISQAILTNDNATIDITSNFNVVDDEFIFKSDGNLEWRQGNDINIDGSTNQETLIDYYRSPISSTFSFMEESCSDLTAFEGRFSFTVTDDATINGTITYTGRSSGSGELELILEEKLPGDYPVPPTNGLNFIEAFTFQSEGIAGMAPGMIGSLSDNSMFLVTREDAMAQNDISPERIIKFNINSGTTEENLFFNSDFVSKQLHIVNNQLVVIGGQYVNTYPLDFSTDPISTTHGLAITRFGMAISDDDAYIVGGDLDMDGDQNIEAEKIYKWNLDNQSLSYVTDLPEDRFGARSAIVNNKLYVFGGQTTFAPIEPDPRDTIFIYDLVNGSINTEQMSPASEFTYVDKYENLIYVGGYQTILNSEGQIVEYDISLGVYNTEDGTYQDLEHNLSQEEFKIINGMCIYNGKLYVIYGSYIDAPNWQIMVSDL